MKRELLNTCSGLCFCLLLISCGSDRPAGVTTVTEITPPPISSNEGELQTPPPVDKFAVLDIAGITERISTDSAGMQGNQNSINSSISDDGQIVVFDSTSSNLVIGDSNADFDIFAKNRRDNSTYRLSIATDGSQANGPSVDPKVSADGRYVVFSSDASNLVLGDTNSLTDVFLHDISMGITTLISKNDNNEIGNGTSETATISADGRYIVFVSESTNFSLTDNNITRDIYLHDRLNATTILVSSNSLGAVANGESISPDISTDGNLIVFASLADNLVASDSNSNSDVFIKNMSSQQVQRISVSSTGIEANGLSDTPSISGDGSVVAYRSTATNLVANVSTISKQIYVKDMTTGENELVSVNNQGDTANKGSFFAIGLSDDGRIVAFYSEADNLGSNDLNQTWDVFIRDRVRNMTQLVSVNSDGIIGDGNSFLPSINSAGNYISFGSSATNLILDDSNASWDIFVHIIAPMNMPPIADAGVDQEVNLNTVVQFDASKSYDPDATAAGAGPVSGYVWQVVSAPVSSSAVISASTTATPNFTPDLEGIYVLGVTVNDGQIDSIQATMTLTVTSNKAPLATIIIDVNSGESPLIVQVDASNSSDPEGDALTYMWDFADPQSGADNNSTLLKTTHNYVKAGRYTIVLTVTDSVGNQTQAFTQVDVLSINHAPEILSVASIYSGPAPLTVQFKANASDPDGDTLNYMWDFAAGSPDGNSTIANPIYTFDMPGTYLVELEVSDGLLSVTQQITIIVDSALTFHIDEAVIEYEHNEIVNGKISFEASINLDSQTSLVSGLREDDRITVQVDGRLLVDVPLSAFIIEKDEKGHNEYVYRLDYLKIEIEPSENKFEFRAEKLLLATQIDNSNGVDFVINIGSYSAVDNVMMQPLSARACSDDENYHDELTDDGCSHDDRDQIDILIYQ